MKLTGITTLLAGCIIASMAYAADGASANAPGGKFEVTLKPLRNGQSEVGAIEVRETISDVAAAGAKPFELTAPVVYPGAMRVADRMDKLEVRDAKGAVTLAVVDDKAVPGGFPYFRHWIAQRAVQYPVTVVYRANVQPPGGPNGPAFGIRPAAGGVSGAGAGFIAIPGNPTIASSHVKWDLSDLANGSLGVSSFGDGDFDLAGGAEDLWNGWYLAGPAQHYAPPSGVPFGAYWLGKPPYDMTTEMTWAAKAYQYLGDYFGYLKPSPNYRVFMRVLDTPPNGGGTALFHSFMLSMGKDDPKSKNIDNMHETLFHEMTHQWVGEIEGDDGANAWFNEGLTVYFTTILPLKGKLESVDIYEKVINSQAEAYYTSPAKNWSADKIAHVGFGDESIRHTPYMRGALYFANLDSEIRARSHGKRGLKDLLMPIFDSRQEGTRFDQQAWEAAITKELGPQAVTDFRAALIEGTKTVVPASDAFGPCFKRVAAKLSTAKGDSVDGYQWKRIPEVADERCAEHL
ncbi:hypothetical protein ISN76_19440 [Dyella halodurans]|uniref:M1 family aminopeptidase n=1 Tax=Dyella halodurans TaxID=1920171 RepID=A0ABV9BZX6_9GAMM|nr:M1 family aminopeptidase [Dyella halodurans]